MPPLRSVPVLPASADDDIGALLPVFALALVRAHLLLPCLQPSLATFSLLLLKLHVLSMLLLGLLRSFLFGFGHFYHFIPAGLCTYSVFLFLFVVSGSGCHGCAEVGGLFSDVDVLVTIRFVLLCVGARLKSVGSLKDYSPAYLAWIAPWAFRGQYCAILDI
jgi:hypothetical protein